MTLTFKLGWALLHESCTKKNLSFPLHQGRIPTLVSCGVQENKSQKLTESLNEYNVCKMNYICINLEHLQSVLYWVRLESFLVGFKKNRIPSSELY